MAELEEKLDGNLLIVTQNVDSLHEKAGSKAVLHMHGRLNGALCGACDHRWDAPITMDKSDACPSCGAPTTRPDIVWFGEIPYHMDQIADALSQADVFVSIGTSGEVYPAANFVAEADHFGAHTIELNLEPSAGASRFAECRFGPASEIVPAWVAEELAQ